MKSKSKLTNPVLSRKELGAVKKMFRLFQDRDGTIDPHEVITSMQTLRLNEKSPIIYELFEEFDTPENSKNRLDYEQFVEMLSEKLSDKESQNQLKDFMKHFYQKLIRILLILMLLKR